MKYTKWKKYLYDIYFNFRSVTRFAKIWLETTAYFILTASQVNVIVVKHSWFRISFWVQGDHDRKAAYLPGCQGTCQWTSSKERMMLSSPTWNSWSFSHLPLPWSLWFDPIHRSGGHGRKLRWILNFGASHDNGSWSYLSEQSPWGTNIQLDHGFTKPCDFNRICNNKMQGTAITY